MPRFALSLIGGLLFTSFASAQIIFEPIKYQYGRYAQFYYGGSDARVIARGLADDEGRCGLPGYSPDAPTRVYCDGMPGLNAAVYGMTPTDARNQAYANAPRYFRKRDLLNAAVPQPDGTWLVPAQTAGVRGTIVIKSYHRAVPATQPTTPSGAAPAIKTGPVFVFPKELLDKPLVPKPAGPVALAQ